MSRPKRATVPAFVARRFALLRLLWASRMWVALALLAFAYVLTFETQTTPLYPKILSFVGGVGFGVWRLPDTLSMWRAARAGEIRQAVVTSKSPSLWYSNGVPLMRMVWRDASGASGQSRLGHAHRFPGPNTKIIVYADPKTGRTWWEDEL